MTDYSKIINKIYLFLSIDLIDSTKLKSILDNWQKEFYDFLLSSYLIKKRLSDNSININIFKVLGDEIIFIIKLDDYKDIIKDFSLLYNSLMDFQENYLIKDIKLKFKTSSWIIHTKDKLNMPFTMEESSNEILDFIGPQMDEGFRIAKSFSRCGQTVISLELAYFLLNNKKGSIDEISPIYFLGMDELKGVWNGNKYPILWYSIDTIKSINLMNYEQIEFCNLSKKFISIDKKNNKSVDILKLLNKIISDNYLLELEKRIKNIESIVN